MISTISQLISRIESDDNPGAIRFEPNWRYVTPELIALCKRSHSAYMNDATAKSLMSHSWGMYQIMGSVLYERGYRGELLKFATDTTLQNAWFEVDVKKRGIWCELSDLQKYAKVRETFGRKYNGDGAAYAAKMVAIFKKEGMSYGM